MIQKKVIDSIYKKYRKRPESPDELNIPLLFEAVPFEAGIEIDGGDVVINSIDAASPFHRIAVNNINAILNFDEVVAIVTHASIIFINKDNAQIYVHIKELGQSFLQKILPHSLYS